MTHSRRLDPAAVVKAGPAEAEATPDPAKPGWVSRMSHRGLLASRMRHSRRPDRGRGRVGCDPLHGSDESRVADPATLPEPRPPWGAAPLPAYRRPPTEPPKPAPDSRLVHITVSLWTSRAGLSG